MDAYAEKLSLKLVVDKETNRVLFAEACADFVDVLFSFLTLPLGTIVRFTGKQSNLGCLDALYESVESLDEDLFSTKACKNMLLRPINPSEAICKKLRLKIDDTGVTKYYSCPIWKCCTETHGLISTVLDAKCHCGLQMNREVIVKPGVLDLFRDGVFVKRGVRYAITDDLQVTPLSSASILHKIIVGRTLIRLETNVGVEEVKNLLKCCLLSKTPLTDMFLLKRDRFEPVHHYQRDLTPSLTGKEMGYHNKKEMKVKLFMIKSEKRVFSAEGNEEFLNLLFGFLTFPLGSVVNLLDANSSLGCIDNLYKSVQDLDVGLFKFKRCKESLLRPKLAPYFGCDNQLLPVDEALPWKPPVHKCFYCYCKSEYLHFGNCSHGKGMADLKLMNPKYIDVVTKSGGGLFKGPLTSQVTDGLVVKPLSCIKIINFLYKLILPIIDLEERVVSIGEKEALKLLKATLTSKGPLSDILPGEEDSAQLSTILCRGASNNYKTHVEDLALQKATPSSLHFNKTVINLAHNEDELTIKSFSNHSITTDGQSSKSSTELIFCKICMEPMLPDESFTIPKCSHVFCSNCLSKYVASKIQDNVSKVKCPEINCDALLELEFCRAILPLEVCERWGNVLCESLIPGSMRFYCPFKDCSGLLLDEGSYITKSECPHCHRLFCVQCKAPWHSGIKCENFQKLGKDEREREDIMLMNLAKDQQWRRCTRCRFYVERSEGCLFMKCRCGHCFCYNCGAPLKEHYCQKCRH